MTTALPEFMKHSDMDGLYWHRLLSDYPGFQFSLSSGGNVIAAGYTVPTSFGAGNLPDDGWDAALSGAFTGETSPSALCALLAVVSPEARGGGVSRMILESMREVAGSHGFERLLAPVRPTLKGLYPLIPMERYIEWRREDGLLYDPWLRVHERLGAKVAGVAPNSMKITGSIAQWESWTKLRLPESGEYIVEGALCPVEIDFEQDTGTYTEPNVWMIHEV